MAFAEYAEYDGLGLAALVAKGHVTPLELAEEAIARIEKHNPRLNAVVYKMYDQGRETARRLAGRARRPLPRRAVPAQGHPRQLRRRAHRVRRALHASTCRRRRTIRW